MKRFGFVLFAFLLTACGPEIKSVQSTEELNFLPEFEARPTIAKTVDFAGVDVPLPQGEWYLVGETGFTNEVEGYPQRQITYASVENGVVDRVVTIWQQSRPHDGFFTRFRYCDDPSYLHSVLYSNVDKSTTCWHLRAVNLGTASSPAQMNAALSQFADKRGLFLSPTMLGVRYVKTQNKIRYYIEYMWSSDLLYTKEAGGVWKPDEWSKSKVQNDVSKAAVASGLIEWGVHWEPAVFKHRELFRKYANE